MRSELRIFISVVEDSADLHGAALVRTAQRVLPGPVHFFGLVGPRLRAAGVEPLGELTARAAMLSAVAGLLRTGWQTLRMVLRAWRRERPDLVILMDSGLLHLPMARAAHRLGIPVLYYIAPQTWASRAWRNRTLARCVDRLACILPFEEAYFRSQGVNATWVGHPLFESLREQRPDPATVERLRAGGRPLLALLPGSRRQVVEAMLVRQLEVVRLLEEMGRPVAAAVSAASAAHARRIQTILRRHRLSAEVLQDNASLLEACDLALVTSGTATLEVAGRHRPMIVMYDAGRLLEVLHPLAGRRVLRTRHLALPNILAGRRIVPEFMPFLPDVRPVAQVAEQILRDAAWRKRMVQDLDSMITPLQASQASENVCRMIQEMLSTARETGGSPAVLRC